MNEASSTHQAIPPLTQRTSTVKRSYRFPPETLLCSISRIFHSKRAQVARVTTYRHLMDPVPVSECFDFGESSSPLDCRHMLKARHGKTESTPCTLAFHGGCLSSLRCISNHSLGSMLHMVNIFYATTPLRIRSRWGRRPPPPIPPLQSPIREFVRQEADFFPSPEWLRRRPQAGRRQYDLRRSGKAWPSWPLDERLHRSACIALDTIRRGLWVHLSA